MDGGKAVISIGRDDGIAICLECKHDDCIGDEVCPDIKALSSNRKKSNAQIWHVEMNRILKEIAFLIEKEGYLLTSEISKIPEVSPNLVFSLIRQGKLKTERSPISLRPSLRGRGNKILVIGTRLFEEG